MRITFVVPRADRQPLMLFRANVGSVIHEGGGSIFKLYGGSPAAARPSLTRTSLQPHETAEDPP